MKLSFKAQPQNISWADLERIWIAAEELPEITTGWLFDHFFPIFSDDPSGPCFEGWTALSFLAGRTQRLRLGLMVTGITYRHPAVLANMCATIDQASGGRLEIGLGASWNEAEHVAYGIEFPTVGHRMDMLDEACQVIHLLLTESVSNFSGEHYQLTDAYCSPKGVQQPRPPFVLGGEGEKRMLRIVAKWADQWNYPGRTAKGLQEKLAVLDEHCAAVGRDRSEIEISMHLFDPSDPKATAAEAKQLADAGAEHLILYYQSHFEPESLRAVTQAVADAVL